MRIIGFQGPAATPAQLREKAAADLTAFLHCAGVLLGPSGGPPLRLKGIFEGRVVLSGDDPLQAMAALRDELRESLEDTFPWPIPGYEGAQAKRAPLAWPAKLERARKTVAPPTPTPVVAASSPRATTAPQPAALVTRQAPAPETVLTPVLPAPAPAPAPTAEVVIDIVASTPAQAITGRAPMVAPAVARAVAQALQTETLIWQDERVSRAAASRQQATRQGAVTRARTTLRSVWVSGRAVWLCIGLLSIAAAALWLVESSVRADGVSGSTPGAVGAAPDATWQAEPIAASRQPQGGAEIESAVSAAIADGFARLEAGQPDLAGAWFEHALALDPGNPKALDGQRQASAAMESARRDGGVRVLKERVSAQR